MISVNQHKSFKKVRALITRSCSSMCEKKPWSRTDHKALVEAVDQLSDDVRAVNAKLIAICGMATADLFLEASTYAEHLREEREELGRMRREALERQNVIKNIQMELRLSE